MSAVWATLSRELRAYFFSPLAYIVGALFLVANGIQFWIIVSFLNDPRAPAEMQPMATFFGQTVFMWLILLFITPVLTMRLISEERRSGTIETLLTAPITEGQVVLGKYLAVLIFWVCLWIPTLAYPGILSLYSDVDWGPVAAGYIGVLGVGAMYLALGVMNTSLTRSQLVAALLTFAMLIPLFSIGLFEMLTNNETLREVFGYLNVWSNLDDFGRGVVDTRRLVYDLSGTVLFLFLATRALVARKWR